MKAGEFTFLGVGDIILDAPDPDSYFDASRDLLKSADAVIGNIEVPHTERPIRIFDNRCADAAPTDNLRSMARGGLTIGTIGGNHCFDQGPYGITDIIDVFHEEGVLTCGAGNNIEEARTPAIVEKNGVKVAALHYNLNGPSIAYATERKVGCAFVRVESMFIIDGCEPGQCPSTIYTLVDPKSKFDMCEDIRKAKEAGYSVVVYFHSGRAGSPTLLQYEIECTHAAIDAGAEAVLCAHTHAMASIGVYRNKPIFFGLGNFVTVMKEFENDETMREAFSHADINAAYNWPGVRPWWRCDPMGMGTCKIPYYAFSEDSRKTLIAKLQFSEEGLVSAGYIPCFINDKAQPEAVTREGKGAEVKAAMDEWTKGAFLDTKFEWNEDGTEVMIDLNS